MGVGSFAKVTKSARQEMAKDWLLRPRCGKTFILQHTEESGSRDLIYHNA